MNHKKIGFALCGSFCTLAAVIPQIGVLRSLGAEVVPIVSEMVYTTDTRFGTAAEFLAGIKEQSGAETVIHDIKGAEPIGPKKLLDALVIAPCTGNTLGKLAAGITDSAVTMAAKAHLRNERPVIVALSTNDALAASAKNIGALLGTKHYYFVPFREDAAFQKPRSCVADFSLIPQTVQDALVGVQSQPILFG